MAFRAGLCPPFHLNVLLGAGGGWRRTVLGRLGPRLRAGLGDADDDFGTLCWRGSFPSASFALLGAT